LRYVSPTPLATPMPLSGPLMSWCVSIFACIATPVCRWSAAGWCAIHTVSMGG
jgi:hypothetical protein